MNLFPTITKFDLTHGRTRMAGRKQRIKNYMENTQQWIPLSGPGGRLPTEADADESGYVRATDGKRHLFILYHALGSGWTHFCPIPKAPPLPKPVELTQDEKDREKAKKLFYTAGTRPWDDTIEGIRYGRSDGRAQLAREALGLFDNCCPMIEVAQELDDIKLPNTAKTVRKLHELLTKALEASVLQASAAGEKP